MKMLLTIAISFLSLSLSASADDLPLYPAPEATEGSYQLVHVVRQYSGSFGADYDEFLSLFLKASQSSRLLQSEWPKASFGGKIWTTEANNPLDSGINIYFKLKSGFRFFAPHDHKLVTLWKNWQMKNGSKTNLFEKKQIQMLKNNQLPFHSGFYDDYKIAGEVFLQGNDATRTLINMNSIKTMKVVIPDYNFIELSNDLKRKLKKPVSIFNMES